MQLKAPIPASFMFVSLLVWASISGAVSLPSSFFQRGQTRLYLESMQASAFDLETYADLFHLQDGYRDAVEGPLPLDDWIGVYALLRLLQTIVTKEDIAQSPTYDALGLIQRSWLAIIASDRRARQLDALLDAYAWPVRQALFAAPGPDPGTLDDGALGHALLLLTTAVDQIKDSFAVESLLGARVVLALKVVAARKPALFAPRADLRQALESVERMFADGARLSRTRVEIPVHIEVLVQMGAAHVQPHLRQICAWSARRHPDLEALGSLMAVVQYDARARQPATVLRTMLANNWLKSGLDQIPRPELVDALAFYLQAPLELIDGLRRLTQATGARLLRDLQEAFPPPSSSSATFRDFWRSLGAYDDLRSPADRDPIVAHLALVVNRHRGAADRAKVVAVYRRLQQLQPQGSHRS